MAWRWLLSTACLPAALLRLTAQASIMALQQTEAPLSIREGHLPVVEGDAGRGQKLKLLIDTGSERSVVDREAARRLQLTSFAVEAKLSAFGRTEEANGVILAGLRLGPIMTSLVCLEKDLSLDSIDAIIGLDLLRRYGGITIDFQARKIVFGQAEPLDSSTRWERDLSLIIIGARIHGRRARLSVDTGMEMSCLYEGSSGISRGQAGFGRSAAIVHSAGVISATLVTLVSMQIAGTEWRNLRALVFDPLEPQDRDGNLGVASLGLERIRFDFERAILSWER